MVLCINMTKTMISQLIDILLIDFDKLLHDPTIPNTIHPQQLPQVAFQPPPPKLHILIPIHPHTTTLPIILKPRQPHSPKHITNNIMQLTKILPSSTQHPSTLVQYHLYHILDVMFLFTVLFY